MELHNELKIELTAELLADILIEVNGLQKAEWRLQKAEAIRLHGGNDFNDLSVTFRHVDVPDASKN